MSPAPCATAFDHVKHLLTELGVAITREIPQDEIVVVDDPQRGVKQMVIDCESPLLILEQLILDVPRPLSAAELTQLLQWNRELIHGAYALDESGQRIVFRDSIRLDTLDLEELQASLESLCVALAEHGEWFLKLL